MSLNKLALHNIATASLIVSSVLNVSWLIQFDTS